MLNFAKTFLRDESGASAAEYALILVIIGGVIVVGALALSNAIGGAMSSTAEVINNNAPTP